MNIVKFIIAVIAFVTGFFAAAMLSGCTGTAAKLGERYGAEKVDCVYKREHSRVYSRCVIEDGVPIESTDK